MGNASPLPITTGKVSSHPRGSNMSDQAKQSDKPVGPFPKSTASNPKDNGVR